VVPAAGDHMSDAFGDDKAATLYERTTLGTYSRDTLEKDCTLNQRELGDARVEVA
jgi:hypothetical protein